VSIGVAERSRYKITPVRTGASGSRSGDRRGPRRPCSRAADRGRRAALLTPRSRQLPDRRRSAARSQRHATPTWSSLHVDTLRVGQGAGRRDLPLGTGRASPRPSASSSPLAGAAGGARPHRLLDCRVHEKTWSCSADAHARRTPGAGHVSAPRRRRAPGRPGVPRRRLPRRCWSRCSGSTCRPTSTRHRRASCAVSASVRGGRGVLHQARTACCKSLTSAGYGRARVSSAVRAGSSTSAGPTGRRRGSLPGAGPRTAKQSRPSPPPAATRRSPRTTDRPVAVARREREQGAETDRPRPRSGPPSTPIVAVTRRSSASRKPDAQPLASGPTRRTARAAARAAPLLPQPSATSRSRPCAVRRAPARGQLTAGAAGSTRPASGCTIATSRPVPSGATRRGMVTVAGASHRRGGQLRRPHLARRLGPAQLHRHHDHAASS
jgi:hypothetical protein